MLDYPVNDTYELVDIIERDQQIKISLSLPTEFIFKNIVGIDSAYKKISELLSPIKELANSAFKLNDKNS